MTARRLLDAAAIFKASRGVAAKHIALRQSQLDIYSKTSSLAKAVKSQTDRVTLTLRAASVLAERFNGPEPDYSTQASQSRRSPQGTSTCGPHGASGVTEKIGEKNILSQGRSYDRSGQDAPKEPPPDGNLGVKQETAKRYPLPDGSVCPVDDTEVPKLYQHSSSQLPQTGHAKAEGLRPTSSGKAETSNLAEGSNLPNADNVRNLQWQAEKQIPSQAAELPSTAHLEGPGLVADQNQDQEVFYTPSSSDGQAVSALPHVKVPKKTEDAQKCDENVPDAQINQDVFYSSSSQSEEQPLPQAQAIPEQEQNSHEAYTELFHSPRVARMLGGQPKPGKLSKGLEVGAHGRHSKQTKLPQEKDEVSFSNRISGQEDQGEAQYAPSEIVDSKPSQAKGSDDVHDLATDMAKDAEILTADPSQVISVRDGSLTLVLIN